jgi:hypothetical protein
LKKLRWELGRIIAAGDEGESDLGSTIVAGCMSEAFTATIVAK